MKGGVGMKPKGIRKRLNTTVYLTDKLNGLDRAAFTLTGCTIRKNALGEVFYMAELKDLKANSVLVVRLEKVEAE